MTKSTVTAKCSHCGNPLPPNHTGPCPQCGKQRKEIVAIIQDTVHITDRWESVHEFFYEENSLPKWLLILITLAVPPLIGLFVGGFVGSLGGLLLDLLLGVLSYSFDRKFGTRVTKVREIRHG